MTTKSQGSAESNKWISAKIDKIEKEKSTNK